MELTVAECVARAEVLGDAHGRAAGGWVIDGNTDDATALACVGMSEGGDPEWWDLFCSEYGPLSGQWSDGLTPVGLAESVGAEDAGIALDDWEATTPLCDAYEAAWYAAYERAAVRAALAMLGGAV